MQLINIRYFPGPLDPRKEKGPWPLIFLGAQGPCAEKKKIALGREFVFSGKGGPWAPHIWGALGPQGPIPRGK